MKKFVVVGIVVLFAGVSAVGCQTVFGGADTPEAKLERVIAGLDGVMSGLGIVQSFAGLDLLSASEQGMFKMGIAEIGGGVIKCSEAIKSAVARAKADEAALEAVQAEAGAAVASAQ